MRETEIAAIHRDVAERGCWPKSARPGMAGYALPVMVKPQIYSLDDAQDRQALLGRGVSVLAWGPDGLLCIDGDQANLNVAIRGTGARAFIVLGSCAGLTGVFAPLGDDATMVFAGSPGEAIGLSADLINDGASMFMGAGGVCYGLRGTVEGANSILIGDGYLISDQIEVRSSDSHSIVDLASGRVVNLPRSIHLEPNVWLGQGATILKGVTVGRGSIVATRALVTKSVAPFCLVAGAPARVMKTGVSWHRPYPTSIADRRWRLTERGFAPAEGPASAEDNMPPGESQMRLIIDAAYRAILNRQADESGFIHYEHSLRTLGLPEGLAAMLSELLSSSERKSLENLG